jgi:hypothetical protein
MRIERMKKGLSVFLKRPDNCANRELSARNLRLERVKQDIEYSWELLATGKRLRHNSMER